MRKSIVILCASFLLTCCQSGQEEFLVKLFGQSTEVPALSSSEFTTFVIVPREGCSSCISKAAYILKNDRFESSTFFIFTGIQSKKEVTIRYGESILKTSQFYIDVKGHFRQGILNSPYPVIIQNEGRLVKFATMQNVEVWNRI